MKVLFLFLSLFLFANSSFAEGEKDCKKVLAAPHIEGIPDVYEYECKPDSSGSHEITVTPETEPSPAPAPAPVPAPSPVPAPVPKPAVIPSSGISSSLYKTLNDFYLFKGPGVNDLDQGSVNSFNSVVSKQKAVYSNIINSFHDGDIIYSPDKTIFYTRSGERIFRCSPVVHNDKLNSIFINGKAVATQVYGQILWKPDYSKYYADRNNRPLFTSNGYVGGFGPNVLRGQPFEDCNKAYYKGISDKEDKKPSGDGKDKGDGNIDYGKIEKSVKNALRDSVSASEYNQYKSDSVNSAQGSVNSLMSKIDSANASSLKISAGRSVDDGDFSQASQSFDSRFGHKSGLWNSFYDKVFLPTGNSCTDFVMYPKTQFEIVISCDKLKYLKLILSWVTYMLTFWYVFTSFTTLMRGK